jgi:hypothetical protein
MPSNVEIPTSLITHSEYVRRIKPLLPKAVFSPSTHQLWIAAVHLLVIASSYLLLRRSHALIVCPTTSIVVGHSLGCLAFIAHDVSHNAVVRKKTVRHLLEMLLWGLNCFLQRFGVEFTTRPITLRQIPSMIRIERTGLQRHEFPTEFTPVFSIQAIVV